MIAEGDNITTTTLTITIQYECAQQVETAEATKQIEKLKVRKRQTKRRTTMTTAGTRSGRKGQLTTDYTSVCICVCTYVA